MIELLNGLKTATLSIKQLRAIAFELVDGDGEQSNLSDRKVIEKICDKHRVERLATQSNVDLAAALCASFNLDFDAEKDFEPPPHNDAQLSEIFWRKIVSFLRNEPWVFICNYAENAASAVHNDVFGITYGFHENVTTWRGLVASGSDAYVVFYNTSSAPHSKMSYSSFARIEKIEESKELDEKDRRHWKAKLSDFHMLSPVIESKVAIAGRNAQHGIQAVTFDTFLRIVELGEGSEYVHVSEEGERGPLPEVEAPFELINVLKRGPSLDEVVSDPAILAPGVLDESMSEKEFSADRAGSRSKKNTRKLDKQTETQAVQIVLAYLNDQGWDLLHDNQLDGVGYDFEFVKDGKSLLIEVKGIRGSKLEFNMTAREFFVCSHRQNFRLIAVTNTLKESDYKINVLCPSDIFQMRRRVTQYRLSTLSAID